MLKLFFNKKVKLAYYYITCFEMEQVLFYLLSEYIIKHQERVFLLFSEQMSYFLFAT